MVEKQYEKTKKQDIIIKAGFDRTFEGVVKAWDKVTETYLPTDITSSTMSMVIVDNQGTTWKTLLVGSGITLTTPASGEYEISFANADSDADDRGTYTYTIVLTLVSTKTYEILKGLFMIL